MTVQFSQIELNDSPLLRDSFKPTNSDNTFEDKLKFEQARLGLLFSPFSQLEQMFNYSFDFKQAETPNSASLLSIMKGAENPPPADNINNQNAQKTLPSTAGQIFESAPLQPLNRQFLQQLLTRTNWLVPNLESQPYFFNALSNGTFQPSYDLQSLIDEIVQQALLVKGKGKTEISLTLKPADLGNLILTVTEHSGIVSIQIQASAETKKLIAAQRVELEEALRKAHVNFDIIQIEEVENNA